jgi:ELWxxDGT repeat protein
VSFLEVLNGKLLFAGFDSNGFENLWQTDGTSAGTVEIQVNGSTANGLSPHSMTAWHGRLFWGYSTF